MKLNEKVLMDLKSAKYEFDSDTGYPKVSVHEKFKLSSKLARIYMKQGLIKPADVLLYDEMADLFRLSHKEGLKFHHTATKEIFCYYTSNTVKEVLGYRRKQYEACISRLESVELIKRIGNGDKNATMWTLPFEQTIRVKRGEEFCGIHVTKDIIVPTGNLITLLEVLNQFAEEGVTVPNHNEELEKEVKSQVMERVPEELQEAVIADLKSTLSTISRPIRMKEKYASELIKDTLKQYEESRSIEKVEIAPQYKGSLSNTTLKKQCPTNKDIFNSFGFKLKGRKEILCQV